MSLKVNLFQGMPQLNRVVVETLNLDAKEDYWYSNTKSIYFTSFFYLSKRFGKHMIFDDYKDAANWEFKVKDYVIRIRLNSINVQFIVFGKCNNCMNGYSQSKPYYIKARRAYLKYKDNLIDTFFGQNQGKEDLIDNLALQFTRENNVDVYNNKNQTMHKDFIKYLESYNDKIRGFTYEEINEKYGHEYSNAKSRHALKTLKQFLQNMLVPFYVRDVYYNIKGQCDPNKFSRYKNNIKIECINK